MQRGTLNGQDAKTCVTRFMGYINKNFNPIISELTPSF